MTSQAKPALISPVVFAVVFGVTALFALTSRYPGFVHHDTAEIVMWSGLGWPLGLPKHPPLLPWMLRVVSFAAPLNWVTLSLLTAGNIVVGAWAVWRIARLYLDEERAAVALMLYGVAPGGTFFAMKFNHNAVLVSLWPLTMLAFLTCLRETRPRRSAGYGVAFGALAAAAMLAKYYSGVLLASCLLAAIVSERRWRFFALPGAYVSVGVFAVLVAPHAWWTVAHGAETLTYAFQEPVVEKRSLLHFLTVAPLYVLPAIAGWLAIRRWAAVGGARTGEVARRPEPFSELWVLTLAPFAITAAIIALFHLRGATSWALPDFAIAGVVLAAMLPGISREQVGQLKRLAAALLVVVAASGPVVMLIAFGVRDGNSVEPRDELALAAGRIFEAGTGRAPVIVAGDPHSANAAAIDLASRPTVYSSPAFSPWVTVEALARDGLLVICNTSYRGCVEQAGALTTGRVGFVCSVPVQRQLLWMQGPRLAGEVRIIMPDGVAVNQEAATAACRAGGADAAFVSLLLR